jgi:iron complex transport system ATP-binding protein
MSAPAGLAVTGLTAGYRNRKVVSELTLPTIDVGRLVALIGPNGAGKSTLLRALAGLVPATGSARLDEAELIGLPLATLSTSVGFVPQGLPDAAALTVIESVIVALRASGANRKPMPAHEAQLKALHTLDRLGIADLALSPLRRLSGGQRQLAGLAQAVVRDPRLLLLDEPTSALDLKHQVEVMRLLRDLAGEGRIVVVVLHDITLAARWADEVVLLDRGALHSAGAPTATLTANALAAVYGVIARVEQGADGFPQITVADTVR